MSIEPESVWRQRFEALKTFASTLHSSLLCNWEESEGLLPRDFDTATGKLAVECVNETLGMLFYAAICVLPTSKWRQGLFLKIFLLVHCETPSEYYSDKDTNFVEAVDEQNEFLQRISQSKILDQLGRRYLKF